MARPQTTHLAGDSEPRSSGYAVVTSGAKPRLPLTETHFGERGQALFSQERIKFRRSCTPAHGSKKSGGDRKDRKWFALVCLFESLEVNFFLPQLHVL